jgi:mono/diheme cytochrome c family protein
MNVGSRRLAALLLVASIGALLGACAGPRWMGPGGPPEYRMGGMPGGMMGRPGMRGHGHGMHGYGPGMRGGYGPGAGGSILRYRQAMMNGIPSDYARLHNPLPASPDVIRAGARLYEANCAACHGSRGAGDGPVAAGLSPPPADLRWTLRRPIAGDGYLMWAISEGGAQLGTGMPAFAGALEERDRWRIIQYLKTL